MILLVDDHEDILAVLTHLLKGEGYAVAHANGGHEALARMAASVPELVVLDYSMPDLDGLSVFQQMRRDPLLAKVPVIMFSAFGGERQAMALREGVDAYVVKGSLDWSDLLGHIRRLAGHGTATIDPTRRPTPGVARRVGS